MAIPPGAEVVGVTYDTGEAVVLSGTYEIAPTRLTRVIAEEDPGILPFFEWPGYVIEEGTISVPDTPGSGLVFHEDRFLAEHEYGWIADSAEG